VQLPAAQLHVDGAICCSYLAAAATLLAVAVAPLFAAGDVLASTCGSLSNRYAPNSTFDLNLQQLVANLPRNVTSSGSSLFATAAIGVILDTIYALLHCRGDLSSKNALPALLRTHNSFAHTTETQQFSTSGRRRFTKMGVHTFLICF
jgi:hypothetical protein